MIKILVAEDEEPIANLIKINLTKAGYHCTLAFTGKEAADQMAHGQFDLALLDIMLPEIDGYELLAYAKDLKLPVMFLTALGTTQNKVRGLRMGADDYLTKPFEIIELLARVEVILRRCQKLEKTMELFDIIIDTDSRTVLKSGVFVSLTMKEFDLLLLFARNRNIALYRDTIYENVWGGGYLEDSRTVDLHVQRLKKKLGWEEHIKTVYKVGYRLE